MKFLALLALLWASPALAQLSISAGASSIFAADGTEISYGTQSLQTDLGAGIYQNRFVYGADLRWKWHGCTWAAGDQQESLVVIGAGLSVANRGISFTCGDPKKQRLQFFTGETGTMNALPYLTVAQPNGGFGAGVSYSRIVGALEIDAVAASAGKQQAYIEGLRYKLKHFSADEAAGYAAGRGYLQADATIQTAHFSAQLSHADFVGLASYTSESISAGAEGFAAFASAFQSASHSGQAYGVTFSHGAISLTGDLMIASRQKESLGIGTIHFRHFIATSAISRSTGTAVSFGGGYSGNMLSGSLNYQEVFNPLGGFQRATVIAAGVQLPRLTLHASFDLLPSGISYSGWGTALITGPAFATGQATQMAQ